MPELSSLNPTGRFMGLAKTYAQFRPSYPAHAADFIMARCGLSDESLLVDVGCGTGIASRLFAQRGVRVIGIEPNADMRSAAAETAGPTVDYRDGRAEATGLTAGIACAVLCAQAFHWFEPVAALTEFHRILKPAGWAILMWNERDEHDPATAAYGAVIRTASGAAAVEIPRQTHGGDLLWTSPLFQEAEHVIFHHRQTVDEEGLLGRAFSASYAPVEPAEQDVWAERLKTVFRQYQHDGTFHLQYQTSVYVARR